MRTILLSLLLLTSTFLHSTAKPLLPDQFSRNSHPPRIIRSCCLFGSKVGVIVLPFIKLSSITATDKIGLHSYLGKPSEENGVIYTRRGGFIDTGHLRDQADWTAFLFTFLQQGRHQECIRIDLGHEGGDKDLYVSVPPWFSDDDLLLLAGSIAFDLSLWHEIATWYGVSSVPMVPERYSSFSLEDIYSNLTGILLGIEAVRSELPYEEAMNLLIHEKLAELEAVNTREETIQAMEMVRNIWWTREARMPSMRVVIARHTSVQEPIYPLIIPGEFTEKVSPEALYPPRYSSTLDTLSNLYDLNIRLNHKFPVKKLFPENKDRTISQREYGVLLEDINGELQTGLLTKSRKEIASLRKNERINHKKIRETVRNTKAPENQNL